MFTGFWMLRALFVMAVVCGIALMGRQANSQSTSQEPGDATRGLAYTQSRCSECHAVDGRQRDRPPTLGIATFEEIANARGMTPRALVVWFQSPHPNMPNLILERTDRDDVIAYIMSLKKGQ